MHVSYTEGVDLATYIIQNVAFIWFNQCKMNKVEGP